SVAVRLIVDREREIRAFVPDESWRVIARLSIDESAAGKLAAAWLKFMATRDEKDKAPTLRAQNAWLAEHKAIKAELVELKGEKFELGCKADDATDLTARVERVAEAVGLIKVRSSSAENPTGKGPQRTLRSVEGDVDPAARYRVKS